MLQAQLINRRANYQCTEDKDNCKKGDNEKYLPFAGGTNQSTIHEIVVAHTQRLLGIVGCRPKHYAPALCAMHITVT